MHKMTMAALTAALMMGTMASASYATDLVIFHTWSAPPEVAALNVLKTALQKEGDTWTDIAIPHDTGANVSLINLVTGGNPPNVFMESDPAMFRDLYRMGKAMDLTQWYKDNGYDKVLPQVVKDTVTVDGMMMKVPVALGVDGMIYYSMEVAKKTGVDPAKWTSLDDMIASFQKVKDAGYIPIAIGAQQWQIGYLTHALAAAISPTLFEGLYGVNPNEAVLDSPDMKKLLDYMRTLQSWQDPGAINRDWNVTTNLVITGKALMQLHGDWMKGEFVAAGEKAGTDFGCVNIPGEKAMVLSIDTWGLLGGVDDAHKKAELTFAGINLDPKIQNAFAKAKGSTPFTTNADMSGIDQCSTKVLDYLKSGKTAYPTPHNTANADWLNSTWDIMFKYWSDPKMTADEAISQLKDAYATILD